MSQRVSTTVTRRTRIDIILNWSFMFVLAIFFTITTLYYLGAGRDDSFITMWAGETLGVEPWFVNYNYEIQEMSSSITSAILYRISYWIDSDADYVINKFLSLGLSLVTLSCIWRFGRLFFASPLRRLWALVAVSIVAFSPVFQYWSLGGLETPIQALLLLLYAGHFARWLQERHIFTASTIALWQVLLILTRPEGFWILVATIFILLTAAREERSMPQFLIMIGAPCAAFILLLLVRQCATGVLFPNPVYAKVGDLESLIPLGARYVAGYYGASGAGLVNALLLFIGIVRWIAVVWQRITNRNIPRIDLYLLSSLLVVGQVSFVTIVGGNWMEYYRFMAPIVPLHGLMLGFFIASAMKKLNDWARISGLGNSGLWARLIVAGLLAFVTLEQLKMNARVPILHRAGNCATRLNVHELSYDLDKLNRAALEHNCAKSRDLDAIVPFIKDRMIYFLEDVGELRIGTYQVGFFPYEVRKHFGPEQVRFFDVLGIMDHRIGRSVKQKNPLGTKGVIGQFHEVLRNPNHALYTAVREFDPNMLYFLDSPEEERRQLTALGWQIVHDVPGAIVYYRRD